MIEKIAHLADIHLRLSPTRNEEYKEVFDELYKSLKEEKPDRIAIVGDIINDYLDLQSEQLVLLNELLTNLAKIAPIVVTRGNHDFRKKNQKRLDPLDAIINNILKNPKITYYNKTGFYEDENVIWAVWHHGAPNNNPWKTKEGKLILKNKDNSKTYIDLFHDPINGCISDNGWKVNKAVYYKIRDFKGDYSFFGDIHKKQYFEKKTKGYCGSLIAQTFSEGDDNFHGCLIWDIKNNDVKEISIHNNYSFKNVKLTPYVDFDELDFDIDNPTNIMKVKIIWNTLPAFRNKENEYKIESYISSLYPHVIISHKNDFIVEENNDIQSNITVKNINDLQIQHKFFKEYLVNMGYEDKLIEDILLFDNEMESVIDLDPNTNIEWDVVKFGAKNFMSYENIDIDWRDAEGIIQIFGINTAGKTTIFKILSYLWFGRTLETDYRVKHGDSRFINDKTNADECEAYGVISANGEYFGIKRKTEIIRNRKNEITSSPTKSSYYVLKSPDDEFTDDNIIDNLTEDNKNKTQKKIDEIIGSYDNYTRIVMTTSDTLNKVLSNDMAVFIDSILTDSGLDIFDKKNTAAKEYQKEFNKKSKIVCNVPVKEKENNDLKIANDEFSAKILSLQKNDLPALNEKINIGEDYIVSLVKNLHKIDENIANLDVTKQKELIEKIQHKIDDLESEKEKTQKDINELISTYDEEKLNFLLEKKENHKKDEFNLKLKIKDEERNIDTYKHDVEIINGKIFRLIEEGSKLKIEAIKLRKSKTCPVCGQPLLPEHQHNIDINVKELETKMFEIKDKIDNHKKEIANIHEPKIEKSKNNIIVYNETIEKNSLEMETILFDIGVLKNEKNDVEKRKELEKNLTIFPIEIENHTMAKTWEENKLKLYDDNQKYIKENKLTQAQIEKSRNRLNDLREDEKRLNNIIINNNNNILINENIIKENIRLIDDYKIQEYKLNIIDIYKKCVHRDGIPRQILINNIIPRINRELDNLLKNATFKVWIDSDDLRPKLAYYRMPNAVIDALSSSGKERTFTSISLKVSLNEINEKSKPLFILLDEVMGKLDVDSVEEFIQMLQSINEKIKRILIIEHNHVLDSEHAINVDRNDIGISTAKLI